MFTVADIRDIAVQIEKNGENAYRHAAKEANEPEIAEIFSWMADEEARHAKWFSAIESVKPLSAQELELEKMGRELLREMVADQTFSLESECLQKARNFDDMLSQSRSFERDTILFYEFLHQIIDDSIAKQQLDEIISEERRHLEQLGDMEAAMSNTGDHVASD